MEELSIPWTPVKAILNVAGKADIRKWVNGVWIDRRGPHLIVWATTGAILGAFLTEEPSTDGPDVFLPRHIVDVCKNFAVSATVKSESDGHMSISCMGTTHYWQDEKFTPADWRHAVPSGADGGVQQFDATLLAPFVKTRQVLHGKGSDVAGGILLAHNPAGMLVQLVGVPDFTGVLMPLREQVTKQYLRTTRPDWVIERGRLPVEETEGADLV